jgi:hypothetical protein
MLTHLIGGGPGRTYMIDACSEAVCFSCRSVTTVEIVKRSLVLICEMGAGSARGDNTPANLHRLGRHDSGGVWAVWAWSGADVQKIASFVELPAYATLIRHVVQSWGALEGRSSTRALNELFPTSALRCN